MFADRVSVVTPFMAMEVFERSQILEKEGRSIIHMELGEPDFDTPQAVNAAAGEALEQGYTHYTNSLGDRELREEIAAFYLRRYQVSIDPGQVLCLPGTSPAMFLLFTALLNPGDEVILSNPYYPCYPAFIEYAGGKTVYVETREDDGFRYAPSDVAAKISPRTKALFLNSPGNPTGVLLEPERMKALADLGVFIVSDEIYHGLTYEGKPEHSILEFTDKAIVVGGFSKAYAMTGWRLGYLILPKDMVRTMQILAQNFFLCASSMVQRAAIVALTKTEKEVNSMRVQYNERRKVLVDGLRRLGFGIAVEPMGAFYVLANARHLSSDSMWLALDILEKAGVGVTPGVDFGSQAEGFLRFSYANSVENIREALRRLEVYAANFFRE